MGYVVCLLAAVCSSGTGRVCEVWSSLRRLASDCINAWLD